MFVYVTAVLNLNLNRGRELCALQYVRAALLWNKDNYFVKITKQVMQEEKYTRQLMMGL